MKRFFIYLSTVLMLAGFSWNCSQKKSEPVISKDKARDYANVLYNKELFKQSVQQYENYLTMYDLDKNEQANIIYIIGDIYFERLRDYENALANYLKIKYLYPESNLIEDTNKKIVACLERLQRSADAMQALEETTSLEPDRIKPKRPGAVVAKIGAQEITQGDLDFEINQLPPYLKSQLDTKVKKLQFLQQYILTQLLYDKAKREQFDKDPDIIEASFQAKKQVMVQKLLERELQQKVKIEPNEVQLYYDAHKDKYAEKDNSGKVTGQKSFDEVKEQVVKDLSMDRQQEALQHLAAQMMQAEGAQIYEDTVK
jgi:hypothetical protein